MINVVEDIAKVMKYDKSHNVKVVVEPNGITVSLSVRLWMLLPTAWQRP